MTETQAPYVASLANGAQPILATTLRGEVKISQAQYQAMLTEITEARESLVERDELIACQLGQIADADLAQMVSDAIIEDRERTIRKQADMIEQLSSEIWFVKTNGGKA